MDQAVLKKKLKEAELSNFLILITSQPDGVNFTSRLFDLAEFIVIKILQLRVSKM